MDKTDLAIVSKIQKLSEERQIVSFARALGISAEHLATVSLQLQDIQYPIFVIDDIYERNRAIDTSTQQTIDTLWRQIHLAISELVPDKGYMSNYIQRLVDFRTMELDMRTGVSLLDKSLRDFYTLKICDIQLQRAAIRYVAGNTLSPDLLPLIEIYDMLGEVIDDLEDIDEDRSTNNPNRFLAEWEAYGGEQTKQQYASFVQDLASHISPQQQTYLYELDLDLFAYMSRIEQLLASS